MNYALLRTIMVGAMLVAPVTARAAVHAQIALLSETDEPRPGSTFLVGFRIVPDPGWHGYWSNPGDSGIPPTIQWTAPGLRFGTLLHPAPTLLKVSGVTSYVHSGAHILLARVRAPSTLRPGSSLPIQARLIWATCSASLCVPQRTMLRLNLRVGDGSPNSSATILKLAAQRLPRPLAESRFHAREGIVVMDVPGSAQVDPAKAIFFPSTNGLLDGTSLRLRFAPGRIQIFGRQSGILPSHIRGVLTDGTKSYALSFRR